MSLRSAMLTLWVVTLGCGGAFQATDDFYATVQAPTAVGVQQPFEFVVTVYNTASESQKLHSLDIDDAYMKGVAIAAMDPPFRHTFHVPIDNTQSFELMTDIPPNGSVEVRVQATAVVAGDYAGEIDVCVGGDARFRSYPIRTVAQ